MTSGSLSRAWPAGSSSPTVGFSKQAYFTWRASPISKRDWDDAHLINTPLVVMEAKCRRTGQDTLAQLLLKWLGFAAAEDPPVRGRGRNAEHKYLDLLELTEDRPTVGVLLVADGTRWWMTAERLIGHRPESAEGSPLRF